MINVPVPYYTHLDRSVSSTGLGLATTSASVSAPTEKMRDNVNAHVERFALLFQ